MKPPAPPKQPTKPSAPSKPAGQTPQEAAAAAAETDALTPEQQAHLAEIQAAMQRKTMAGIAVGDALKAAHLTLAQARGAQRTALEARTVAAQAQVTFANAQLEASRLRDLVNTWARQMASSQPTQMEMMLGLVLDTDVDPFGALRTAEASDRAASTMASAYTELDKATEAALQAQQQAAAAAAEAAKAEGAAKAKQSQATDLLVSARAAYERETGEVSDLASGLSDISFADLPNSALAGCEKTDPNALYLNGQLPMDVLCALPGYPGHMLRTDAAAGFLAMSKAFATRFGTPLCITDTYRSYAAQVDLRARKPTLAAVPGTSNHGWGVAIDMCGGIENFGTPEHNWMMANGSFFGWADPAWAQAGGSKPEPWHFEFSPELAKQMRQVLELNKAAAVDAKKSRKNAAVSRVGKAARNAATRPPSKAMSKPKAARGLVRAAHQVPLHVPLPR